MPKRAPDHPTTLHKRRKLCLLNGVSVLLLLAMGSAPAHAIDADALPSGGVVVGGNALLDYSTSKELHVRQDSDRAVIDWDSFNIGVDARTQFHQPSNSSWTVNRVTKDGDPTQILGSLSANGKIMVLDRNGVIFGPSSRIDVSGLIVSTGNVTNHNALYDNQITIHDVNPNSVIVNAGTITVKDAGLAAFVAPTVVNTGIIQAKLGRIDMGAGSKATIDLYGDGLVELTLDKTTQQTLLNTGLLHADGGTITMQAAAAKDIVDNIISNAGIMIADSVGTDDAGRIILYAQGANKSDAQGSSVAINNGFLSAKGLNIGGSIDILGDVVLLGGDSIINASGDHGGGNIKIGGDYLGGSATPTALYTFVYENALILNDAITQGDGGRTIIWSDHTTDFHGSIFARGGDISGNGGFVETSGKMNLLADGYVDLTAAHGNKGTYLLDPADITIYGNFDPGAQAGGVAWYDAHDEATIIKTGTSISGWNDKIGTNEALTALGSQAQWISNGLNGKAVVRFDGNGTLVNASFPDFNDEVTTYWVGTITTNTQDGVFELGTGAVNSGYNLIDWGNVMYWRTSTVGGHRDITQTFNIPGSYIYTGLHDGAVANMYRNGMLSGTIGAGALQNTISHLTLGGLGATNYRSPNDFGELIIYNQDHSPETRALINQYLSAKWGVALDPLAGAGSEAAEAMDSSNGYGVFTTRYLERLSSTADIILQAGTSITLDLKGDTLALTDDRSISLTTTGGDIKTASDGKIVTNRTGTGGNITFNAGDDIDFAHAFTFDAQNGGEISLTAADAISAPGTVTALNGTLTMHSKMITGEYTGKDAVMNSTTGQVNATVSFDTLDIAGAAANLVPGRIGAAGPATQSMANRIKIGGQTATGNASYKFGSFVIGHIPPPEPSAPPESEITLTSKIVSVVQQTSNAGWTSETSAENDKDATVKSQQASAETAENTSASADCLITLENVGCVVP